MGHFYDEIPDDPKLIEWIKEQKIYHVASAPLKGEHVNVSPRAYQSFKLVSRKACWFLDLSGSGNETISHLYEPGNGRITILFQAFQGPPRIVRLYGKGKVFEAGTPEFDKLLQPSNEPEEIDFPTPEMMPGARAIIWIDITRVGTACGFAVPFMKFEAEREQLITVSERMEERDASVDDPYQLHHDKGLKSYWVRINSWSVDGLPGMKQCFSRMTPESIRQAMEQVGIKNPTLSPLALPPPSQDSKGGKAHELTLLSIGLLLGALLMSAIQRRLQSAGFA
ncbi:uncharacterized protein PHACADRAFT_257924 [Phanerochaete carnosa HHB-10118-sp]|uniref:Pyridoxamine 5'-phosphate oxidase putative domain-containing protein n=1 Tax=Phanerochaete carnosa (strain HHB-10118-sp) TaxID=650164 RepID=K5W513_PHACS|nr:uncharacterized protein PHACADRAFT_257924 [Phanerochaete carnosa HHB-10118-sp]EKM54225.1 hypothetical protein PHACADRAFT_257924 [Phanerochaete carnosa HHB-10118-sp]